MKFNDYKEITIKNIIDFITQELIGRKEEFDDVIGEGELELHVGWRVYTELWDLLEHHPIENFRGIKIVLSFALDVNEIELVRSDAGQ